MCGIVGTVGNREAASIILEALRKLEYRGYDSAGIATIVSKFPIPSPLMGEGEYESHLETRKGIGKLMEVEKACGLSRLPGTTGIGHVRWATHGGVTIANAHPHFDCTRKIAVVHNGIIENFQELREYLKPSHTFTSETDTEVIAHLIEEELQLQSYPDVVWSTDHSSLCHCEEDNFSCHCEERNFSCHCEEHSDEATSDLSPVILERSEGPQGGAESPSNLALAVYNVTRKLRGSYAILVISSLYPGQIVAARKDSPLVVGLGKDGNFLASDILCFLDKTDRAIYIEDGEIVVLTSPSPSPVILERSEGSQSGDGHSNMGSISPSVRIFDTDFKEVHRSPVHLDLKAEEATKQGHPHYMKKEILEQPEAIRRALQQDKKMVMDMAIDMLRAKQVVLTACGTSRYAALVGRYAFSKLAGIFSEVVMGSEFQYFSDSVDKNTVVIAISQSGETADVIQGVRMAKRNGAKVFSVVNTPGSTLDRLSDRTLHLRCGPEIAVAATKSFISQLSIFYLLSFAMTNHIDEGIQRILPLSGLIDENLKHNGVGLAELAGILKDKRDFYYIGRGINFAIAGESALKMKEVSYVHAEGMSAGELKHGTLALIERGTPVVALCPNDYTMDETLSNVMETKARGAYVIGVSDKPHAAFDDWIHIPAVDEIFYPLVCVIPLQLFAYHSALARGYDPDKPRNLAKSVTVK